MTITHISLDLETWGTSPGCDLRSIGACVFVPHTGQVVTPDHIQTEAGAAPGTFYIATDNPRGYWGTGSSRDRFFETGKTSDRLKYPLKRDHRTVQWWSEQSAEAQAAFENPVDLKQALDRFTAWLTGLWNEPGIPDIRLWCHGPAFDIPILAAAYEAVGLPVPWHYRAPRDTRTAFDMAGIDDHSAYLAKFGGDNRVPHHALSDAICQAQAVSCAYIGIATGHAEFVHKQRPEWIAEREPST